MTLTLSTRTAGPLWEPFQNVIAPRAVNCRRAEPRPTGQTSTIASSISGNSTTPSSNRKTHHHSSSRTWAAELAPPPTSRELEKSASGSRETTRAEVEKTHLSGCLRCRVVSASQSRTAKLQPTSQAPGPQAQFVGGTSASRLMKPRCGSARPVPAD